MTHAIVLIHAEGSALATLPPAWGGLTARTQPLTVTEAQSAGLANRPFLLNGPNALGGNGVVVPVDVIGPSEPWSSMNCCVLDSVRLCTAIGMSWWATLRARLAPITARPVRPNRGPLMAAP